MATFKSKVFAICEEVAGEFEDWKFARGCFMNKTFNHTDLMIQPGFYFRNNDTPLQPSIVLSNKKFDKICKELLNRTMHISLINFREVATDPAYMPAMWLRTYSIVEFKESSRCHEGVDDRLIDIVDVKPVIRSMLKAGVGLIERFYDLSSEKNFFRNLPPKYISAYGRYEEMEMLRGLRVCLAHVLLGDFDFIRFYRSDDFATQKPKEIQMLDSIIAALPELERRFAETGKVI